MRRIAREERTHKETGTYVSTHAYSALRTEQNEREGRKEGQKYRRIDRTR